MPPPRRVRVCAPHAIACPACGAAVPGLLHLEPGALLYLHCGQRAPDPTRPGRSHRCGQHVAALALGAAVYAAAITRAEFRVLTDAADPGRPRGAHAAARALGIRWRPG